MASIHIEWISDYHDCETCGSSYAEGATVTIDGTDFGDFTPCAHCYDSKTFSREQILFAIIEGLGNEVIAIEQPFTEE